jgi:hypothetical protein
VIEVGAVNAREIVLAERLGEIEPEHLRADGAVESANLDGLLLTGGGGMAGISRGKGSRHRKLFVKSVRRTPSKAQSDEFTGARAQRQRSKSDTFICCSDKPDV